MNLLFSINTSYITQFITCIKSIVRFPNTYDIYVFNTDLQEEDQEKIQNTFLSSSVTFHFIKIDNTKIRDFPTTQRYPLEIYYRIFASQYLPSTIDKILYLDVDIIVIQPLDELYAYDLQDDYFAACTHVRKFFTKINNVRLGSKEEYPYINTGVLLMNVKELRKHQDPNEVFDFINHHDHQLLLPDQDIISMLYGDHIRLLDPMKYNLSERILSIYNAEHVNDKKTIDWVRKNTVILHYCGKNKPWNQTYFGKLDIFYHEVVNSPDDAKMSTDIVLE